MVRSVKISTPIPTVEEVAERLGVSKARQKSLARIMFGHKAGTGVGSAKSSKVKTRRATTSRTTLTRTRTAEG